MAVARPMYQQIAEDLRQQIESGVLTRDSQLPTELELRDTYAASRNTVRNAIMRLTILNLVETRPGRGTFVVRTADPFVTILSCVSDLETTAGSVDPESAAYLSEVNKERPKATIGPLKVEIQVLPPEVAWRFRLEPSAQVVSRHQQRFADDTPWLLQISFYPAEFITGGAGRPLTAEDVKGGAVHYAAETTGLKQAGHGDWGTVRNRDGSGRAFSRITREAAVLEDFRMAFDESKRPMRVVTVFPADCAEFIVRVGRVSGPQSETDAGKAEWLQTGPLALPARPAA
jgi:GntR family transcriptional regulator